MRTKKTNKTVNILLVEDYASLAMMFKELASLYAPSCKIKWVDDGQKAVEEIKQGKDYETIIMNYLMPVMDGIEATRHIRALGYKGTIIGWSAFLKADKEQECLKAGMNFYVEKSGNLDPTIEMLRNLEKNALIAED